MESKIGIFTIRVLEKMKPHGKTIIILLTALFSTYIQAQNFETNFTLSPLLTFKSSEHTENKRDYGFAVAVQEFYNLTDHFAIGSEITYSYENYTFTRDAVGHGIPESSIYYEGKLTVQSLKIPLMLRLKTSSTWSFAVGYGLTYNIDYKVSVDYVYSSWFVEEDERTEIPLRSVQSENDINGYYTIGLGKTFKINNLRLLTELFYNKSFANYSLEHSGRNAEILYSYNINPQRIGLRVGVGF